MLLLFILVYSIIRVRCFNGVIGISCNPFEIAHMKSTMMTTQEVCAVLGISLSTLRRRVKAGELRPAPKSPGQKRAYRLQFLRADIERLLNAANR